MYSFLLLLFIIFTGLLAKNYFFSSSSYLLSEETASFGFLLLSSFFAGRLFRKTPVPQLTGYLLMGIIVGPFVLDIVPELTVKNLLFINDLALALIAFAAGSKVKISVVKQRAKVYFWITLLQTLVVLFALSLISFLALFFLLGKGAYSLPVIFVSALILGSAAVAKSPSTTIAVILESKAEGEVTDTVIGVTIIKDVVIIFLFTLALSLADMFAAAGGGFHFGEFLVLLKEIFFSIVVGVIFGIVFSYYFRGGAAEKFVFMLGSAFFISLLSKLFHLHFLLSCMVTGFVVENFTYVADEFHKALEESYLPILIVFFSISGASLDLGILKKIGFFALGFVMLRMLFTYLGNYWGAVIAGEESKAIRNWSWMGYIGQAGLTLGFAAMIENKLPGIGPLLKNLLIAAVVVNQIIGPVMFRIALEKAGEVGRD